MTINATRLTLITATLTLFGASLAFAQTAPQYSKLEQDLSAQYPDYFQFDPASVRITLIEEKELDDMSYVKLQEPPARDLNGVLVTIDNIINIAQKVWAIVERNQPVVNIDTRYATAYPEGITSASQLANWSRPKSYSYGFYAENLYGMTMVNARYRVTYTYNGNYQGKGKYLTGVSVIPTVAEVGWGYTFAMTARVPDSTIANVGTSTSPVAAMQLVLGWKISTILKESDGTSVYYIQGDGHYEEIASPFDRAARRMAASPAASRLQTDPQSIFGNL